MIEFILSKTISIPSRNFYYEIRWFSSVFMDTLSNFKSNLLFPRFFYFVFSSRIEMFEIQKLRPHTLRQHISIHIILCIYLHIPCLYFLFIFVLKWIFIWWWPFHVGHLHDDFDAGEFTVRLFILFIFSSSILVIFSLIL